jgi:hypothetical protein
MAIAPGQRPDGKGTGLKSGTGTGRARSGTASGADPTNLDGQYPPGGWGGALFGGALPSGTGAPGSRGARGGADPTTEPGQLDEGLSGLGPADTANTGAPGRGTTPNSAGGGSTITFTDPGTMPGVGAYRSESVSDDLSGPRDSTMVNDQGYGSGGPQIPGIGEPQAGSANWQTGRGTVLRGGRDVRP